MSGQKNEIARGPKHQILRERRHQVVVSMDGRQYGYPPKAPEKLVRRVIGQLPTHQTDARLGRFRTDLLDFLENKLVKALEFESLYIVGKVGDRCGEIVAKLLLKEKHRDTISAADAAKQVQCAWYACYFCGEVNLQRLRDNAGEVIGGESKLSEMAKDWRTSWKAAEDAENELTELPQWDERRQGAHEHLEKATEEYQSARTALLELIGPRGQPFDPCKAGDKENNYIADWRAACEAFNKNEIARKPKHRIERQPKPQSAPESRHQVVVSMDGRQYGHLPKAPEKFVTRLKKELQTHQDDASKERFRTDLPGFLERKLEEALEFESLYIVGKVGDRCGEIVAELLLKEKHRRMIRAADAAKQVRCAWYACYFCGEVNLKKLRDNAGEVTGGESKLSEMAKKWRASWEAVGSAEEELTALPRWDERRQGAHEHLEKATKEYQSARTALLEFMGPREKPFDPYKAGDKENNYVADWKAACETFNTEQAKKLNAKGRSVAPDAGAIKAARSGKKMTQEDLATGTELSLRTIRRMEGKKEVRIDKESIRRVATCLGVDVESLVKDASGGGSGAGGTRMLACFTFGVPPGLRSLLF